MSESRVPFRADIVGSFLRPASLKKAREEFTEGKISALVRSADLPHVK